MAGTLIAPEDSAAGSRRGRPRKPHKITLPVTRRYQFRYGNYQLQKAVAQTRDPRLARFLTDKRQLKGIEAVTRRVWNDHTCADLLNGQRLARLQRKTGRALAAHYTRKTRRNTVAPTVILFVGLPYDNCDGDCPAPTPICKPPNP